MQIRSFQRDGDEGDWHATIIQQHFCSRGQRLRALFLMLSGGLLCAPLLMIATDAPALDHAARLLVEASASSLALLLMAVMGSAAIASGLHTLLRPALRDRQIEISAGTVSVNERIGRAQRRWHEPLAAYRGVRHRVITTSSGPAHNLVLEHPMRDRSVVIANAPHLAAGAIATASKVLNLPVLSEAHTKTPILSKGPMPFWSGLKAQHQRLERSAGI